jgi:hypothetical protein
MSRALIPLLVSLAILSGCVAPAPVDTTEDNTAKFIAYPTVEQLLNMQQSVDSMEPAEAAERLAKVDKTAGVRQLFYFGLLNQRLEMYGAWTVARDTFQKLQENEKLHREPRQLAGILRQYNQSRINNYLRQEALLGEKTELQQQLDQAREEGQLLKQKIQALTEVETAISTRREE